MTKEIDAHLTRATTIMEMINLCGYVAQALEDEYFVVPAPVAGSMKIVLEHAGELAAENIKALVDLKHDIEEAGKCQPLR